jgi:signal transduction histidine kinase
VLGNVQLLARRLAREPAAEPRHLARLATITDQVARLTQLVNSLLDISRIRAGQLAIEPATIDLGALVRRVAEHIQPTLESHMLKLDIPPEPLLVSADAVRIEQAIENLLGNAVKYSPKGGEIDLSVGRAGANVWVHVSDQGIGIPVEALPQIFDRYFRAGNADEQQIVGLGIGLYVVKEIVDLHGGTITVQSSVGTGSTFSIYLPSVQG